MFINELPPIVANQIAAGEVVERPAAVVKELVENAFDAGATQVWIEIEQGGSKRISVRDNGRGIAKEELHLALKRHATSKIKSLNDLDHILSMGFRGEALASIAAVSRLVLSSKPKEQDCAYAISVEGISQSPSINPTSHPNGTTIDVEDLFFNTPARKRFLRAEKTEFQQIEETVRRLALSRPDCAISLKHNGKIIFDFKKENEHLTLGKRMLKLYGSDFVDNAIKIEANLLDMSLTGFVRVKEQSKVNQYFFLNNRVVKDKTINHAIATAFEEVKGRKLSDSYVCFLTMPPSEVDINVHPQKSEVRFREAKLVHDFITTSFINALRNDDQIITEDFSETAIVPKTHGYTSGSSFGYNQENVNDFVNALDKNISIQNNENILHSKQECESVEIQENKDLFNNLVIQNDINLKDELLNTQVKDYKNSNQQLDINKSNENKVSNSSFASQSSYEKIFGTSKKDLSFLQTDNFSNVKSEREIQVFSNYSEVNDNKNIVDNYDCKFNNDSSNTNEVVDNWIGQADLFANIVDNQNRSPYLTQSSITTDVNLSNSHKSELSLSNLESFSNERVLNNNVQVNVTPNVKVLSNDTLKNTYEIKPEDFDLINVPELLDFKAFKFLQPWLDGELKPIPFIEFFDIVNKKYALVKHGPNTLLIDLENLSLLICKIFLQKNIKYSLMSSKLLVSVEINIDNYDVYEYRDLFLLLGFEVSIQKRNSIVISAVPCAMRSMNVAQIVNNIFEKINPKSGLKEASDIFFTELASSKIPLYFVKEMVLKLLGYIVKENFYSQNYPFIKTINMSKVIQELFHE